MSKNKNTSTKKIAAGAVGAAVVGTAAGGLTYKSKADYLANQLMDDESDYYHNYLQVLKNTNDPVLEKKLIEDHSKLLKEADVVVKSAEFQTKAAALRNQSIDYSAIVSSRNGLEHLEVPELVDSVRIMPAKRGGYTAKVMLNETGLQDITRARAKEKCMTGVKFDPHTGVATEGGFLIHHIPEMPEMGLLVRNEEKGIHEIPHSQLDQLGKWIERTEKSLEEVEYYIDQGKSKEFSKIFRESATNGWCWKHMPKSDRLIVGGVALVGTAIGGIIGSELVHSKRHKRELERSREAGQASPIPGV